MIENRILIVDDEEDLANIIKDFLEDDGMKVEIAGTGEQAYSLLKSYKPNLVILDIMLPDEDGKEICRRIRSESDIPVIMLSAKDSDIEKILALGLGADEYLTKPFSPAVMVAQVKAVLRRFRNQTRVINQDLLDFGDLCMNVKMHSVTAYGEQVNLVSKEFEVLWFLASQPGVVFTKEDIYDAVWGTEEFGEISTVTVHIRKIRAKLEKDAANPRFLKTIWGVGYKFEA
jgi:two-component system response regulator VicR